MTAMRGSNPTATVTDSLAPTRPADAELGGPRPTDRRLGPTTRAGGRRAPRRRWPPACFQARLAGEPSPAGERPARRVLAGYRQTAGDDLVGQGPVRRCGFARSARTCASIGAAAEGESAHVGPRHIPAAMKEQAGDHRAADRASGEDLWSCRLAAVPRVDLSRHVWPPTEAEHQVTPPSRSESSRTSARPGNLGRRAAAPVDCVTSAGRDRHVCGRGRAGERGTPLPLTTLQRQSTAPEGGPSGFAAAGAGTVARGERRPGPWYRFVPGNREKNTPGGAASNGVSGRCVGGPRPQQQPAATAELEGLSWQSIMDSTTPAGFKRLRLGRSDAG